MVRDPYVMVSTEEKKVRFEPLQPTRAEDEQSSLLVGDTGASVRVLPIL